MDNVLPIQNVLSNDMRLSKRVSILTEMDDPRHERERMDMSRYLPDLLTEKDEPYLVLDLTDTDDATCRKSETEIVKPVRTKEFRTDKFDPTKRLSIVDSY
jgi:hypothetical protein